MTQMELPDTIDLAVAPELGSLALLDAALIVADHALHIEHANLADILRGFDFERPPDALVAALLTARFRELRSLLALYTAAVQRIGDNQDIPF
jgi:hypothetical protein